jgi:hypothetical protein
MDAMSRKQQRRLFEEPEPGRDWLERPPLDPTPHLKEDLVWMMKVSCFSRAEIVERMNFAYKMAGLPGRMSLARLDAWAAKSKKALPDLREAEYLYWAAANLVPMAGQAGRAGAGLINQDDKRVLDLGKTEQELRRLGQKARRLRQEIGG